MADISFIVFKDDDGFYRLEESEGGEQERIDMTEEEADTWIAMQTGQSNGN